MTKAAQKFKEIMMDVILGALVMLIGIVVGALIVLVVHKSLDRSYIYKNNFNTEESSIPVLANDDTNKTDQSEDLTKQYTTVYPYPSSKAD